MPPGAPTLRELRRGTADRVAPFTLVRSGVEQSNGVYAGTDLSNSRRRIVSTDLASLTADGQSAETPPDYLKNEWALVCSTPVQQRRIPEGGYMGAGTVETVAQGYDPALAVGGDPCGALTVDRPFTTIVEPNLDVEIHAIPALRAGRSAGLHVAINHALHVILREDTVAVPGESGRTTLDVTASFPWLTRPDLFISAQYVQSQAGVESWTIPGASLRFDADRVLLTTTAAVATGQTFPVRVLRPLSTWIMPAATGIWGESVVGLVDDLDQCLGDTDAITLVAAFHVADGEARNGVVGSAEAAFWAAQAQAFAQRSAFLRDQRVRGPRGSYGPMFPDFVSVDGPYRGRWGPGWR